jgi:Eukaryotic mitochondrial regulator protein
MVPKTPFDPSRPTAITPHESINDLPVHVLTKQQLFYPTSESRPFNRVDAGRVFSAAPRLPNSLDAAEGGTTKVPTWQDTEVEIIGKKGHEMQVLKPADSRIPHPHLIAYEKDKRDPELKGQDSEVLARYKQRLDDDVKTREEARAKRKAREEAKMTRIETGRWEFVIKDVKATIIGTGLDGRGTGSPGYRYGVPAQDRKRAQVKIPTRVNV